MRERVEVVRNPGFGLEQDSDYVFLHRAMIHADLRVGDEVRAFVQLGAFRASGREAPGPPTDRNALDFTQAFVDVSLPLGDGRATLRGGRQEVDFGSSRLISVREGPNVRRTFDGVRAFWSSGPTRVDAFYLQPVAIKPRLLDDSTVDSEALWGVYATTPVAGALKADLYYLGTRRERAQFAIGTADERRHSIGARLFGDSGGFDWDIEGVVQFGSFGNADIAAWTIASDIGFTFTDLPLTPRLGLKADSASGDANAADATLGTFNALYPKFPYFSEANLIAPANVIDLHPSVDLTLSPNLSVQLGWNGLWRQTTQDAIYMPPLTPIAGSIGGERFIGHQAIVGARWSVTDRVTISAQDVHFEPGNTLDQLGGSEVDFGMAARQRDFERPDMRIELRHLRMVIAVTDTGSFTSAAARLGIQTSSAASKIGVRRQSGAQRRCYGSANGEIYSLCLSGTGHHWFGVVVRSLRGGALRRGAVFCGDLQELQSPIKDDRTAVRRDKRWPIDNRKVSPSAKYCSDRSAVGDN